MALLNASYQHPQRHQGKKNNSISVTRFSATMQRNIESARAVVTVPKPIIIMRIVIANSPGNYARKNHEISGFKLVSSFQYARSWRFCEQSHMKPTVWIILPALQTRLQKGFAEGSHCASPNLNTIAGQIRVIVEENGAHEARQESATEVPLVGKTSTTCELQSKSYRRRWSRRPGPQRAGEVTKLKRSNSYSDF